MLKRKVRSDRNHALYAIHNTVTGEMYIGITVCSGNRNKALKVRMQKHIRRALTEGKTWALCSSIREHGADAHVMELIEVVRGKKAAHARETEIINQLQPALNTFGVI